MANHYNTSFSIEKKVVVLVKPSKPTPPPHALFLTTLDNAHNLWILYHTIYVYKSSNDALNSINLPHEWPSHHPDHELNYDNNQIEPASVIEKALLDIVVSYYPLAGMMKRQSDGRLQINCNAIGVPFSVANVDCQLSSLNYLDGIDIETAQKFVFDFPSDPNEGEHPLVLQVTKFTCGGFTIGIGLSHSSCDGSGVAQFEFTSDPASLMTSPFLPTDDILHECFNVHAESIKRLKAALIKECEGDHDHDREGDHDHDHEAHEKLYFTTLEVLSAYVWRAKFRALKLNPDEKKTILWVDMNIRHHLNPPLLDGYYGNAIIFSEVVLTGKDLNQKPLFETVNLVNESKKSQSTNEYIYKTLEISERKRVMNVKSEASGAKMSLTDWKQLGLIEDMDFGWGDLGNLVYLPCGVRVQVSLLRAVMSKFNEEMDALKLEDDNDNDCA